VKKNVTFGTSVTIKPSLPVIHKRPTNRTLRWETTTVTNLGVDLNLLNNRIQILADYFYKSNDGIPSLHGVAP